MVSPTGIAPAQVPVARADPFKPLVGEAVEPLEMARAGNAQRANTVALPARDQVLYAAGARFIVPGIGPMTGYAVLSERGVRNGNPGIFLTVPLQPGPAARASLGLIATAAAGGGTKGDLVAGALFHEYQRIQNLIRSGATGLPKNAVVTPLLMLSIPSREARAVLTGGLKPAPENAQIGLGLAVTIPASGRGPPGAGKGVTLLINTTARVSDIVRGASTPGDSPFGRNMTFAVVGNDVRIPKLPGPINVAAGFTVQVDVQGRNRPWQLQTASGETVPMPRELTGLMNVLANTRSPLTGASSLGAFLGRIGLDEKALQAAGRVAALPAEVIERGLNLGPGLGVAKRFIPGLAGPWGLVGAAAFEIGRDLANPRPTASDADRHFAPSTIVGSAQSRPGYWEEHLKRRYPGLTQQRLEPLAQIAALAYVRLATGYAERGVPPATAVKHVMEKASAGPPGLVDFIVVPFKTARAAMPSASSNVSAEVFQRAGMPADAAPRAMVVYNRLRSEGLSPENAFDKTRDIYAYGLAQGGWAGGLKALIQ